MSKDVMIISTPEDITRFIAEATSSAIKHINSHEWVSQILACEMLGVSPRTLRDWRTGGKITYTQTAPKVFMFSRAWIQEYMNRNAKKAFHR